MQEEETNTHYQVLWWKIYIHALSQTSCQLHAAGFIFPVVEKTMQYSEK